MSENEAAAVRADYERAAAEMDRLTSAVGGPGAAWRWSIPAKPDRDSDLIFAAALEHIPTLLARLEAVEALADKWEATNAWTGWDVRDGRGGWESYNERAANTLRAALTAATPTPPPTGPLVEPVAAADFCLCGLVDDKGDGTCGNCGRHILTDDDEPVAVAEAGGRSDG